MSLVTPWLMADRDRFALMHGDYRLDNMLFDPDRTRVTVVDWQTLGVGLPARDLAYFTGTSLLPGLRVGSSTRTSSSAYHDELLELRRHGLRPRHLLARLPGRHAAGAADRPRSAARSPSRPNAATT